MARGCVRDCRPCGALRALLPLGLVVMLAEAGFVGLRGDQTALRGRLIANGKIHHPAIFSFSW